MHQYDLTKHSLHVMVHSVTLARTDVLPENGHTVTETCWRFYEIFSILMCEYVLEFYL